jgi:hypothetical protein
MSSLLLLPFLRMSDLWSETKAYFCLYEYLKSGEALICTKVINATAQISLFYLDSDYGFVQLQLSESVHDQKMSAVGM